MIFDKQNKHFLEWSTNPTMDPELQDLLANASDEELNAAFNLELEFGTAGIRGILGAGPGRFNVYTIKKVTICLSKLLLSKYPDRLNDGVVIGHDNRHNSKEFAQLVAEILTSFNIKAYLFANNAMKPTPLVSYATKKLNAIAGVVITASHNPAEYNGYKIYDPFGCQLMPEDTDVIATEMDKITDILNWNYQTNPALMTTVANEITKAYEQMIADLQFYPNETASKKQTKIIFSAVNGTGTEFTPVLLRKFGYDVIEVAEHAFEDETFKNVGNPNPEFAPAWIIPLQYGEKHDADIIIINDPDADRIGIAVKHDKQWVRLNGNETGPLLIQWKLSQQKKFNKLPVNPALYSSFVTSDLGDRIAHETYGVEIIKTLTGFKWMGDEIAKEASRGLNFVFAYEESFGYVLDASTRDKDGIQASVVIAEACWYAKTKHNKTLIDVLDDIYDEYGFYFTDTVNLNVKPEEKAIKLDPIMKQLRTHGLKELAGLKVVKVEDYIDGLYNMPGQNLLKFYFEDGSWFAARPSGTEPKLKIYFVVVDKNQISSKDKQIKMWQDLKNQLKLEM
ncbi:phospho-sugar mutase [Williamsoniiplasma lucivorax]|uniref:Phosphoglucomutase/phosphomannomutase n=1 Tax=Williamsoniiplasma lucivorax TaxID=209274 RepID=A0A2S5RDS1_9MOLU|nr:phospho-sugar mutase [Williamsoniiplasma lucivorax]PPE05463.1 phosphoglucomutase/phosphomannomutase [Williamsoniiplasma lucivorax]